MVPSYNAAATLPFALSSLVAQTCSEWECIIIDDGSTDQTTEIATQAGQLDARIRFLRFDSNCGRGAARQAALEQAGGKYLAMLDADDWLYPGKLERQLAALEQVPDAVLVSSGMAIEDSNGELAGVRCQGISGVPIHSQPPIALGGALVSFAPSLIRLDMAKAIGFDGRLRRSEDYDFLLRLLMKHRYCVIPDITYVYSELASVDRHNVNASLHYGKLVLEKYRKAQPREYWRSRFSLDLHVAGYRALFAVGLGDWVIRRRSRKPTPAEIRHHHQAQDAVREVHNAIFGTLFSYAVER